MPHRSNHRSCLSKVILPKSLARLLAIKSLIYAFYDVYMVFYGWWASAFYRCHFLARNEEQAWACSWPVIKTQQLFLPWLCLHLTRPCSFIKHSATEPLNILSDWPLQSLLCRCSFATGLCNCSFTSQPCCRSLLRSTDRHTCVTRWGQFWRWLLAPCIGSWAWHGTGYVFFSYAM